jgi:1-phosphofructokinase family hexose kinase
MIVTVTANTTIDQTVFVPRFEKNKTIRASSTVQSLGGKPTDASWILGTNGIPSLALGFAAGSTGHKVETLLQARGVMTDFTWVGGDTRINIIIIVEEDPSWSTTITTTTLDITPEQIEQLRRRYQTALDTATVVVTGGTLPRGMTPDFYIDFITLARERGIPVIFDAAETNLKVGLTARPDYIKPNRDELEGLVGRSLPTLDDIYAAAKEIYAQYGTNCVVTLGGDGALAVLPDKAYFIPPLDIEVVSAAGAGDGMLAGLAAAVHRRAPIEEGLRLGAACASAVCLMPGTADCRREDVERLLPQIELRPFP